MWEGDARACRACTPQKPPDLLETGLEERALMDIAVWSVVKADSNLYNASTVQMGPCSPIETGEVIECARAGCSAVPPKVLQRLQTAVVT